MKWGVDAWRKQGDSWEKEKRQAGWDDWLFEPKIDVLLQITPREWFRTRGLGRHPHGYVWIYGARHDQESGTWLGLLGRPLRPGIWNSTNPALGRATYLYEAGHKYPDIIQFARPERGDFRLEKRKVEWNPNPAAIGFEKPGSIVLDPDSMPVREVESVTAATRR